MYDLHKVLPVAISCTITKCYSWTRKIKPIVAQNMLDNLDLEVADLCVTRNLLDNLDREVADLCVTRNLLDNLN